MFEEYRVNEKKDVKPTQKVRIKKNGYKKRGYRMSSGANVFKWINTYK